jgi:hypothetical protein
LIIEGAWLMPTVASTLCPPPCAKWEIRYSHLHMVGHCLSPLTNNIYIYILPFVLHAKQIEWIRLYAC